MQITSATLILPRLTTLSSNPTQAPTSSVGKLVRVCDCLAPIIVYAVFAVVLWLSLRPSFYYLVWFAVLFWILLVLAFAFSAKHVLHFLRFRFEAPITPRLRFHQNLALTLLAIWCLSIFARLPLRLAFLTAKPALEKAIKGQTPATFPGLTSDISTPLFKFEADFTNYMLTNSRAHGFNTNRIILFLADNHETAFIYSPAGINDLAYNSGSAGHLFGPWYWMAED